MFIFINEILIVHSSIGVYPCFYFHNCIYSKNLVDKDTTKKVGRDYSIRSHTKNLDLCVKWQVIGKDFPEVIGVAQNKKI